MMNILLTLSLPLFPLIIFLLLARKRSNQEKRIPPGSLGLPFIGQSLSLLWQMRSNTAENWLEQRAKKYGPVSKLSLFGKRTVFIYGQAANKLVFCSDSSTISNEQVDSLTTILGDRCLLNLAGEDHKRVRGALVSFLKPECLKMYVGKMEDEVRYHIETYWEGKQNVTVLPLIKTLTFDIICSLLFGIERGVRREQLVDYFRHMIQGMWAIPINIPFTRFNRSIKDRARADQVVKDILEEKRLQLHNGAPSHQDLISCLLSVSGEDGEQTLSEKEIFDNVMLVLVAGYDTSSVLITFMMRLLATNLTVYEAVLKEQEEIFRSKSSRDHLTWEDLGKMKYTWKVVQELLRLHPPIFGGFRKAVKEIEYGGYIIPQGWQIFWATSMTQMDGSIFQEPSKFDPTRFDNPTSIPPYCFVPFGGGARICPGYEFAKMETLVTLYCLVNQFKWKLCCPENCFKRDPMPEPPQGLPIRITPRNIVHPSMLSRTSCEPNGHIK